MTRVAAQRARRTGPVPGPAGVHLTAILAACAGGGSSAPAPGSYADPVAWPH